MTSSYYLSARIQISSVIPRTHKLFCIPHMRKFETKILAFQNIPPWVTIINALSKSYTNNPVSIRIRFSVSVKLCNVDPSILTEVNFKKFNHSSYSTTHHGQGLDTHQLNILKPCLTQKSDPHILFFESLQDILTEYLNFLKYYTDDAKTYSKNSQGLYLRTEITA